MLITFCTYFVATKTRCRRQNLNHSHVEKTHTSTMSHQGRRERTMKLLGGNFDILKK